MTKTLTYSGIAIVNLFVILLFVTSKSYAQLGMAVALYPIIAYLTLKLIPRTSPAKQFVNTNVTPAVTSTVVVPREKVDIVDIDKRTFLKMVGTAGISFFIFSLLGRRVEDLIFNKTQNSNTNSNIGLPPSPNNQGVSLPNDEYRISEIDDGVVSYYGFINKDGGWLIMREDTEENSFRYAKGTVGFSKNWSGRENLKYDYYHDLF